MMKKRIKIAQIGICHEHASGKMVSLRRLPDDFEIVGVVDDNKTSHTPKFAGNKLTPYEGLKWMTEEEVLNTPDLQAVLVEVPNNDLVPVAMRCMERGLAIHMDKPAGEDLGQYKKLLDGCKKRDLPFQMGFMFRGNPAFQFCIAAIREKLIGEVFELEADMHHCYGGDPYQDYIGSFPGGIMYNLGGHLIDFTVAAMGAPERVTPFLKAAPGYPDTIRNNCMAVLEYLHATAVVKTCSKALGVPHRRVKVNGTNGSIEFSPVECFHGPSVEVDLILADGRGSFPAGNHTLRFPPQADRFEKQLAEFARIIRGEMKNPYTYEHDYLVHKVTLAASNYIKWS